MSTLTSYATEAVGSGFIHLAITAMAEVRSANGDPQVKTNSNADYLIIQPKT